MTAYFVAVRTSLSDPEAFAAYREKAALARVGHAMTPLAAYGRILSIEGAAADGAVILAFPTFQEAQAWYYSDAYQEIAPIRQGAGVFQTFIIQGVD